MTLITTLYFLLGGPGRRARQWQLALLESKSANGVDAYTRTYLRSQAPLSPLNNGIISANNSACELILHLLYS